MGDGPNVPWRLLDIEILVEDPETGGMIFKEALNLWALQSYTSRSDYIAMRVYSFHHVSSTC